MPKPPTQPRPPHRNPAVRGDAPTPPASPTASQRARERARELARANEALTDDGATAPVTGEGAAAPLPDDGAAAPLPDDGATAPVTGAGATAAMSDRQDGADGVDPSDTVVSGPDAIGSKPVRRRGPRPPRARA